MIAARAELVESLRQVAKLKDDLMDARNAVLAAVRAWMDHRASKETAQ